MTTTATMPRVSSVPEEFAMPISLSDVAALSSVAAKILIAAEEHVARYEWDLLPARHILADCLDSVVDFRLTMLRLLEAGEKP